MIDPSAREQAAYLLDQCIEISAIDSRELDKYWPQSEDAAIGLIHREIHARLVSGEATPLDTNDLELLDRCRLFLRSGRSWEPDDMLSTQHDRIRVVVYWLIVALAGIEAFRRSWTLFCILVLLATMLFGFLKSAGMLSGSAPANRPEWPFKNYAEFNAARNGEQNS